MSDEPCWFCGKETANRHWTGYNNDYVHSCPECAKIQEDFDAWLYELFLGYADNGWSYPNVGTDFFKRVVLPRAIELGHLWMHLENRTLTVRSQREKETVFIEAK
jgi:hypothetical protein